MNERGEEWRDDVASMGKKSVRAKQRREDARESLSWRLNTRGPLEKRPSTARLAQRHQDHWKTRPHRRLHSLTKTI